MPSATNALTKAIIHYLSLRGFNAWRQNNGAVFDPTKQVFRRSQNALLGVPDIIGYRRRDALFIAVEVKTGPDRLSAHQQRFLQQLEQAQGLAIVARTFDGFKRDFEVLNRVTR